MTVPPYVTEPPPWIVWNHGGQYAWYELVSHRVLILQILHSAECWIVYRYTKYQTYSLTCWCGRVQHGRAATIVGTIYIPLNWITEWDLVTRHWWDFECSDRALHPLCCQRKWVLKTQFCSWWCTRWHKHPRLLWGGWWTKGYRSVCMHPNSSNVSLCYKLKPKTYVL